jgi:hypothetical protein
MKGKKSISALLVISLIMSGLLTRQVSASESSWQSSKTVYETTEEIAIAIQVSNLQGIGTIETQLSYDPAYLSLERIEEGPLMMPLFGLFSSTATDGQKEILNIAIASIENNINTSGTMATVYFKSRGQTGTTMINMDFLTAYPGDFSGPQTITPPPPFSLQFINPDILAQTVLARSWQHGANDPASAEYWNLQALDATDQFSAGESMYALSKIKGITKNHRWKNVFYHKDQIAWVDESPWLDVGAGWAYSNALPLYNNLPAGPGKVAVYLDLGEGYILQQELPFNVISEYPENHYLGTEACSAWAYGLSEPGTLEYWNLRCLETKNVFLPGERAYLLSKILNVSQAHEWLIKVYHNDNFLWEYASGLQNQNNELWGYANFAPYVDNLQSGTYRLETYFRSSGDYALINSQSISVSALPAQSLPFFASFESTKDGFITENNSDISLSSRLETIDGRSAILVEHGARDIYWHAQLKKIAWPFEAGQTYKVSFWLKGEGEGKLYLTAQKESSPWNNLGLWQEIDNSGGWKKYESSFVVNDSVEASDIRLSLMLGDYNGKIWIDDFSISK